MKKKQKPLKLGQINTNTDRLEKYSDSITWSFDYTLLVFIRDGLKRFLEVKDGCPLSIAMKYEKDEDAINEWNNIIQTIIDNIDYYLSDEEDHIPPEDKDYYTKYILGKFENIHNKETRTILGKEVEFNVLKPVEERTDRYKLIDKQLDEIRKLQHQKLMDAFDLIKKWVGNFWW